MQRYALKIQYDGTQYVGYQVQENGPSVQAEIERGLRLLAKVDKDTRVANTTSGRTDSGVHALGQVIHVDYPKPIHAEGLRRGLNSILKKDIRVLAVAEVDESFHARYSAIAKEYIYRVDTSDYPDPFRRLYTYHHPYRTDVERMQAAMETIIGTHDFTSFCSTKTDVEDKVRTIYQAQVWQEPESGEIIFRFYGNGFLYNMIRILVGTLLQIGDRLKPVGAMEQILAAQDRNESGPTAEPQGLYLKKVYYQDDIFGEN